jgi:hypothetical protein
MMIWNSESTERTLGYYKASRYKSKALRLWPERCNNTNPTRCCKFPTSIVLTVARQATVVTTVPSTVHYPTNYKIKVYYLNEILKCK